MFKRGDLVCYRSKVYYYQPNGQSGYLYDHKKDIGNTNRVAFNVGCKQLSKPTQKDIEYFNKETRPLRTEPDAYKTEIVILPFNPNRITIPVYDSCSELEKTE